jgi:hypothetical protein
MQVKITINGAQSIQGVINARLQQFAAKVDQAVQGAGIDCQALAKQDCPVDTGRLRASITYTPGKLKCSVGTNVKYAPDIEFGHVTRNPDIHVAARPFLFPAYATTSKQLVGELKAMVI